MGRMKWTVVVFGVALAHAPAASADVAPAPSGSASAPSPASAPRSVGLAVVALAGAADVAWPLAQSLYADPSLRPGAVDEPHARVLCGEAPAASAPADLRDLSDTVAALRGDDAPSRALLDGIARRFAVRALVVVRSDAGRPTAQLFLAETAAFDAAVYAPAAPTGPLPAWSATLRSLDRLFTAASSSGLAPALAPVSGPALAPAVPSLDSAPSSTSAPTLATREAPKKEAPGGARRAFYESVWFWAAVGAAALVAGTTYIATRDSSPSAIHLEVQVPH